MQQLISQLINEKKVLYRIDLDDFDNDANVEETLMIIIKIAAELN